jgi:hypothetical protein
MASKQQTPIKKEKRTLTPADIEALKGIFATKEDLKSFAMKEDLTNLVTKADAKNFATKNDLKETGKEIIQLIFEYIDKRCATKDELAELRQQISHLPTKEDFYSYMDKLMGEVQTLRDEQTILGHQVSTLADRVDELEN